MTTTFEADFDACIRSLAAQSDVFVLQIGAGNGVHGDYLHAQLREHPWRALLLEPVQHIFEQLLATYQNCPHVRCERLAVADRDGTHELYRVDNLNGLPWWADQLASFKRSVILSHGHLIHGLEARVVTELVPCMTVATLLQQFSIRHVDLLVVDVEGCDALVVSQFLATRVRPTYVLFEHRHLPLSESADLALSLRNSGYALTRGAWDTFCRLAVECHVDARS